MMPARLRDYVWLALACVFAAFPVLYMLVTSFKTRAMLYEPARFIFSPTLENYRAAIINHGLYGYIVDSLIVSLCNVAVCLTLGTAAAYAIHKFSFPRKEAVVFAILSSRIFPSIALVLPFYVIGLTFEMLDTYAILIVTFMVFNLPFVVLMMRSYLAALAPEVEEAAMLDGCSRLGVLVRIVLPQVRMGLFATAIMCFLAAWNEFTYALFLSSSKVNMVSTAVVFFKTERGILWGEVSALGVVAVLPVIVLCFVAQKYLVKGMS
ncbi:carbohydrate ABC transporter permease [Bosea sp. NBC_00550]|uniref:carbohydrate ABC transporter permease n=1 Tax=Bosea sp. NBC_00550 TaxID=2969621 RepID=UPI00222E6DF6|nr:carbohydrate ABC transporter permease [Bosea sp. NBC_00550]UZF91103.1 carbohydrate ABC transporter permease [Bosea sp. NBC_00550]